MSTEELERLESRIDRLAQRRRRLARRQRSMQKRADAIGAFRYCPSCQARGLQAPDGKLPQGWTVHAIGDTAAEHEYFCPEHRDWNPDVNSALTSGQSGHDSLLG